MNPDELQEKFARELREYEQTGEDIVISLTPLQAVLLVSTIQLASRHPQGAHMAPVITSCELARLLEQRFAHKPHLARVIEMGWYPNHDVEETPY